MSLSKWQVQDLFARFVKRRDDMPMMYQKSAVEFVIFSLTFVWTERLERF